MVRTASTMLALGTEAPDFELMNIGGRTVQRDDFRGAKALLVMFICNHCPYVKHVAPELPRLAHDYQPRGVAIVAINSNDATKYPDDSPERMIHEAENQGYCFPYLYDETQETAHDYHAACTPDFFLFDGNMKLAYRGQLDSSRPNSGVPLTGEDLRRALDAVLAGQPIPEPHRPSIGCNIKWRDGNEPEYWNPQGVPK
jgi:peroxiredoxin